MKLEKSYNTKQYFHSFYRQNHALLVLSFLFTVICFPANLIGSWLLGQVIDAITEVSMNRLRTIILVSIIFIVTMFFFTILLYWVKSNFIRKALIQYKNLAFEKISEKNIAAFSRENTGSYISMLTNDAASIEENYLRKSFLILHYVLLFFGTLIMMLRYSIVLTFATIVLGFLPAIASILMGKELSSREKIVSDKNETFVTQLKNLLAGFSVIKSFQAEKETQELFNTTNAKIEESKCKRYWWECLLSAVSQNLCGNLMQFGIFLFGASLAIHGDITAGTVLIFFNLCNFIIMPVNIVPQYLASRRAARGLIEKLSQMTVDNAEHTRKNGSRRLKAFLQRWQTKIIFACRLRLTEKFYLIKVKWVNTIIYGSHKPNTHHIQISLGDHGRIPSGLPCGHIRPSIAVRHHRRPENTPQRHRTACGVWRGYCQRPQGSEPLPCGDPSL